MKYTDQTNTALLSIIEPGSPVDIATASTLYAASHVERWMKQRAGIAPSSSPDVLLSLTRIILDKSSEVLANAEAADRSADPLDSDFDDWYDDSEDDSDDIEGIDKDFVDAFIEGWEAANAQSGEYGSPAERAAFRSLMDGITDRAREATGIKDVLKQDEAEEWPEFPADSFDFAASPAYKSVEQAAVDALTTGTGTTEDTQARNAVLFAAYQWRTAVNALPKSDRTRATSQMRTIIARLEQEQTTNNEDDGA